MALTNAQILEVDDEQPTQRRRSTWQGRRQKQTLGR
jgi:hypothetical protein